MRRSTFDPIKLKTGDTVYFLRCADNEQNLRFMMSMVEARVIHKTERIIPAGQFKNRRQFTFKLHTEVPVFNNKHDFEAIETTPLFTTKEAFYKYFDMVLAGWKEGHIDHEERHKRLEGTLYEHNKDV